MSCGKHIPGMGRALPFLAGALLLLALSPVSLAGGMNEMDQPGPRWRTHSHEAVPPAAVAMPCQRAGGGVYRAGVDAYGRAVAPADLAGSTFPPPVVEMDIPAGKVKTPGGIANLTAGVLSLDTGTGELGYRDGQGQTGTHVAMPPFCAEPPK